MTKKEEKPKITFTRTSSDVNNKQPDSLILEVDINNEAFAGLYFQDNSWKIIVSTLDSDTIHIEWTDFLGVIHELHKHIAVESEIMLSECKKSKDDEG